MTSEVAQAWKALEAAAAERGGELRPADDAFSPDRAAAALERLEAAMPPAIGAYFALSNGLELVLAGRPIAFGGLLHFPEFDRLERDYRRVYETSDDRVGAMAAVFPVMVSDFGEFVGFAPHGQDERLYEITLRDPRPRLAFSSIATAIAVCADYARRAVNLSAPGPAELTALRRSHRQLDPFAAESYWA